MSFLPLRKAFTLMEVNLAIFIMATGVLAMVSLYSLGFRENSQSEEDVMATSNADCYLAPLIMALSSEKMTWSQWISFGSATDSKADFDATLPNGGWNDYVQKVGSDKSGRYRVNSGCNGKADSVASKVCGAAGIPAPTLDGSYSYALVLTRRGATISLAFRSSRRRDSLMNQPIFYAEVHFQGDKEESTEE